tara:strand:+ start:4241 stop:4612 length:372 start_codon:yes stop_codon:yes gene_type:complete
MSDNTFIDWLETELAMKEKEDMARRGRKKKVQVPSITDLQLVLTNRVKKFVQEINESGVEYVTYSDVTKLNKAFDDVVEEANLKYQQTTIEHGEDKGKVYKAFWKDIVRADHPNIYVEKDDDE